MTGFFGALEPATACLLNRLGGWLLGASALLLVALLGWLLGQLKALVFILALAWVLTYLLLIPVNGLQGLWQKLLNRQPTPPSLPEPWPSSRLLAVMTVFVGASLGFGFLLLLALPPLNTQIKALAHAMPGYIDRAEALFHQVQTRWQTLGSHWQDVPLAIEQSLQLFNHASVVPVGSTGTASSIWRPAVLSQGLDWGFNWGLNWLRQPALSGGGLFGGLGSLFGGLMKTLALGLLVFFALLEGPQWPRQVLGWLSLPRQKLVAPMLSGVHMVMMGFIKGQVMLGLLTGIYMLMIYSLFGIPYALLLSLVFGLAEVLPVVGTWVGITPGLLVILFSSKPALIVPVWLCSYLYQTIKDNFIQPRITGQAMGLHPAMAVIALFLGARLAGVLGLLLALPLASSLWVILKVWYQQRVVSVSGLGGQPLLAAEESPLPAVEPLWLKPLAQVWLWLFGLGLLALLGIALSAGFAEALWLGLLALLYAGLLSPVHQLELGWQRVLSLGQPLGQPVAWLQGALPARLLAVVSLYALLAGAILLLGAGVLPALKGQLQALTGLVQQWVNQAHLLALGPETGNSVASTVASTVANSFEGSMQVGVYGLTGAILLFYALLETPKLQRALSLVSVAGADRPGLRRLRRFLRLTLSLLRLGLQGQWAMAAWAFLYSVVLFKLLHLPYAAGLALVFGLFSLLPVLGVWLGALMAWAVLVLGHLPLNNAVGTALSVDTLRLLGLTAGLALFLILKHRYLAPRWLRYRRRLHALVVLLFLLLCLELFGVAGVLFYWPLLASVLAALKVLGWPHGYGQRPRRLAGQNGSFTEVEAG